MSRPRQKRYCVSATLVADRPLHVGGRGADVETDLPLAVDGQGAFYVPGTAFAGAIAAWVIDHFHRDDDDDAMQQFFGYQKPAGAGDQIPDGYASFVTFDDAPVTLPGNLTAEIHDGVGIDRKFGTAKAGIKFVRAVLPRGTMLPFSMSVEIPPEWDKDSQVAAEKLPTAANLIAILHYFLKDLQKNGLMLGAGQTRGLGRVKVVGDLKVVEEDWSTREGILEILEGSAVTSTSVAIDEQPTVDYREPDTIRVRIDWEPVDPVMSKSAYDGVAVDTLPFVSGYDQSSVALMLAGSGIKGAMRSRAECIVRTLEGEQRSRFNTCESPPMTHLEQLDVPLVNELFGYAKRAGSAKGLSTDGQRGQLQVGSCYTRAENRIPTEAWHAVTSAPASDPSNVRNAADIPLNVALKDAGVKRTRGVASSSAYMAKSDHVGIDRWTNAPVDGLLYSTLEPFGFAWEDIELTLQLPRADKPNSPASDATDGSTKQLAYLASVALLIQVLRELSEERLPLGFGVNRGFGSIKVNSIKFETASQHPALSWLNQRDLCEIFDNGIDEADAASAKRLAEAWTVAVKKLETSA